MDTLAAMLRSGRLRLGLDQAGVAQRVGVGQQAVSRWEQGTVRPRSATVVALAEALDLPVDEVLAAAGYTGPGVSGHGAPSRPVRPLLRTLPFHELSPERFEDVSVEILEHMHPGGHATRFGGSGDRQDGIDVLIDGGVHATAQCKRHKRFGPKDVQKAVQAVVTPGTRNYLFLSRPTATAPARAEMAKHHSWQLWDGDDLSRYIRAQMSKDDAVRMVDTYFPNHREPFLGIAQPGPWLTTDEFYATASSGKVFSHDWTLVGRLEELAVLQNALTAAESRVVLLFGRGGIGKTRLLRSISQAFEGQGWTVRLLPAGSEPDPQSFELLPSEGNMLLIIDDAHERQDGGQIVARVLDRNPRACVLIASRPYGAADLDRQLRPAGLLSSSLPSVTLPDLSQNDATALAREALGPAFTAHADRLAALTRDCPLATTVGGYLIRTGVLDPDRLEQDDIVRDEILRGFMDALLAESAHGDRDQRRAVVDALSALQPFRTGDPAFQVAIATLLGTPYSRIAHHLRSLEDSGVVIRRGDSLRLVPDLLGDVVLADACFDRRTGADTGYLSEVLEAAAGEPLAHAFVNIARVDWQVGHRLRDSTEPFWRAVYRELERQEIETHIELLDLLSRVAPFQPQGAIDAVRWILDHPVDAPPAEPGEWVFRSTWREVVDRIPGVLRSASYTLDTFRATSEILWELAQTDRRPTNQYSDHPLRVLQDLAKYERNKPLAYNEVIIELAESWIHEPWERSPLEALENLVATEETSQTYSDYTITFRPFGVRLEVVRPVRRRAINLALSEIRSGNPIRGVAGAKFIRSALRYPSGAFGRQIDPAEIRSWDADFIETIQELHEILRSGALDPVVHVASLATLHWHADYGTGPVHDAAETALTALPDTVAFGFALLLHDGWGQLVRERGMPYEAFQRAVDERVELVSAQALDELDDAALVSLLEERLDVEMSAFERDVAGGARLLAALAEKHPSLAITIVDRLHKQPGSSLSALAVDLVRIIGHSLPDELMPTVRRMLDHPSPELRVAAATGLAARSRAQHPLFGGELELLRSFATSTEAAVRIALVQAARALAATDIAAAADLVTRIPFADSSVVADRLFMYLNWDPEGLTWDALSPEQRSTLLAEVRRLSDLENHGVQEFLRDRSAEDPSTVLQLLRERIQDAEGMEHLGRFRPVPYTWDEPLRLREHPDYLGLLRELLAWMGETNMWQRRHMGKDLFAGAAGSFDDPVLAMLLEVARSGTATDARTVATVLENAPNDLVFDHVSFVADVLTAAARFGPEAVRAMRGGLWASAIGGGRSGIPGEPFAEDLRLRDEGAAIAEALPYGSLAAGFYRDLSASAARSAEEEVERDRIDGREW